LASFKDKEFKAKSKPVEKLKGKQAKVVVAKKLEKSKSEKMFKQSPIDVLKTLAAISV